MKLDEMEVFHGCFRHVAVHFEHYILVFSGFCSLNRIHCSHHKIWMYNLYTEQWRACELSRHEIAPRDNADACAVRVGEAVYMFGGLRSYNLNNFGNDLWQLSKSPDGLFSWYKINITNRAKKPSGRIRCSGWEYDRMVWIFGGHGDRPTGFLNYHGDFTDDIPYAAYNNQLLCFNPSSVEWMDVKCFGSVPTPRSQHSTTIIRDKVWLYGGKFTSIHELYCLSMCSFEWTQIQTGNPQDLHFTSISAISDTMLILHGKNIVSDTTETWVIDLLTSMWKQYSRKKDHPRMHHTGHKSINNNVIIIGGRNWVTNGHCNYAATFDMMLEPRSLQQLAMQTIFKHKDVLPWKHLPKTLTTRLGITENE